MVTGRMKWPLSEVLVPRLKPSRRCPLRRGSDQCFNAAGSFSDLARALLARADGSYQTASDHPAPSLANARFRADPDDRNGDRSREALAPDDPFAAWLSENQSVMG
jgi:hypothetical protein